MIHPHKFGLALGALAGVWHIGWSLLVFLGIAQDFLNFMFEMHFLKPVYKVAAFDIGTAIILIIVTSALGYLVGFVGIILWNILRK